MGSLPRAIDLLSRINVDKIDIDGCRLIRDSEVTEQINSQITDPRQ